MVKNIYYNYESRGWVETSSWEENLRKEKKSNNTYRELSIISWVYRFSV